MAQNTYHKFQGRAAPIDRIDHPMCYPLTLLGDRDDT
jgi:hypothetical protein